MGKKQTAFAGSWYPGTARECESAIQQFLKEGRGKLTGDFVGGIVPHAGWYFSGSIAARVIASLLPQKTNEALPDQMGFDPSPVDTILLFGAHMSKQSEPFIMTDGWIETPFGDIEVDGRLVENIAGGVGVRKLSPEKFPDDNTLELQYPFIKYFFPGAKIVVCGVAPTGFAGILGGMAVEEATRLSRNIRVIGSTDMTHYGPDFGFTPVGVGKKAVEWVSTVNDKNAIAAMGQMDEVAIVAQGLDHKNMCCPGAAAAAVAACKKKGAIKAIELDYATSFERSRSDSFVGYAGLLFMPGPG
ncbi:MAG: AmmeMemoRadiSam system protein B [Desulfobacteraceae bacterium]|nr:AmmeMemoRadiSam system protein B [Desulfobacteraceae bacterium]